MNARPYPEGFFTWDQDERNSYFAKAAAAYREENAVTEARPTSALPKVVDADIILACCRFRGHRDRVFQEAGGAGCRGEGSVESSRSRRSAWWVREA
jgi:hypothetical protein